MVVGSVGLRFFFDPGCLGRPLWPADSGGSIAPLPCFPGSRRFIGGPLALLVMCLYSPAVLAGHWVRVSYVSVFWTGPYLALSAAHVCSIIFGSIFPLWVGLSGWFAPLVLFGRWSSAFWSGPSFLMVL